MYDPLSYMCESFLYARLETVRIMWLGMAGGRASTQVSVQ